MARVVRLTRRPPPRGQPTPARHSPLPLPNPPLRHFPPVRGHLLVEDSLALVFVAVQPNRAELGTPPAKLLHPVAQHGEGHHHQGARFSEPGRCGTFPCSVSVHKDSDWGAEGSNWRVVRGRSRGEYGGSRARVAAGPSHAM
eukprot:scaffold4035_cov132-Isochrysis_galbana.AAC.2